MTPPLPFFLRLHLHLLSLPFLRSSIEEEHYARVCFLFCVLYLFPFFILCLRRSTATSFHLCYSLDLIVFSLPFIPKAGLMKIPHGLCKPFPTVAPFFIPLPHLNFYPFWLIGIVVMVHRNKLYKTFFKNIKLFFSNNKKHIIA